MNLLLWRHADASDGFPDHQRALTDKGRAQAKRVAAWLNDRLPDDAVILVSPAVRAQQTADALKRNLVTSAALDTDTDAVTLLKAATGKKREGTTLVVGHQPTLGRVASLLLTGIETDLSVKKGSVWWFTVHPGDNEPGVLKAMMTPEML